MGDKLDFRRVFLLLISALLVTIVVCILVMLTLPMGRSVRFTATVVIAGNPPTPTPTNPSTRNNNNPCDPNNLPPSPPLRNAGINAQPPKVEVTITLSKSVYPETAAHIEAAQQAGHPRYLTVDRPGNIGNARRNQAIAVCDPLPGMERDEYPLAMFREGGQGASVRYVRPGDNKGAGATIGGLLRNYRDGTIVEIKIVP